MSELLIFTIADGRYKAYADLFTLCAKRAYPEYDVEVYNAHGNKEMPYWASCVRFIACPSVDHFYTYITDVDMMICPERQPILEFHLEEMRQTGLCYSNVPRWKEPMGENRMTGLHFVNEEWWGITHNARDIEKAKLNRGEIGSVKCDDELMLMRIIKASGLGIPLRGNLLRRHHGIHLGTLRDYRSKTLQQRRNNVRMRIRPHAGYWCNMIETADYKAVVRSIKDKDVLWELRELEKFARQLV